MAWDDEFLELMPETITIEPVTGRDEYSARTFGTATSHRARVTTQVLRVLDFNGNINLSQTVVWVAPTPDAIPTDVLADARITLPDGTQPPLLSAAVVSDEDGPHHLKLMFGPLEPR